MNKTNLRETTKIAGKEQESKETSRCSEGRLVLPSGAGPLSLVQQGYTSDRNTLRPKHKRQEARQMLGSTDSHTKKPGSLTHPHTQSGEEVSPSGCGGRSRWGRGAEIIPGFPQQGWL